MAIERAASRFLPPDPKGKPSTPPEALILFGTIVAGLALAELPYEEYDGGLIPAIVLFRKRPQAFQALIIAIFFAASCTTGAIIHREGYPTYAACCRWFGAACLVIAAAATTWAVAASSFWAAVALCVAWPVAGMWVRLAWRRGVIDRVLARVDSMVNRVLARVDSIAGLG